MWLGSKTNSGNSDLWNLDESPNRKLRDDKEALKFQKQHNPNQ